MKFFQNVLKMIFVVTNYTKYSKTPQILRFSTFKVFMVFCHTKCHSLVMDNLRKEMLFWLTKTQKAILLIFLFTVQYLESKLISSLHVWLCVDIYLFIYPRKYLHIHYITSFLWTSILLIFPHQQKKLFQTLENFFHPKMYDCLAQSILWPDDKITFMNFFILTFSIGK